MYSVLTSRVKSISELTRYKINLLLLLLFPSSFNLFSVFCFGREFDFRQPTIFALFYLSNHNIL